LIRSPVDHAAAIGFLSVYPKTLKKDAFGDAGTMFALPSRKSL
jgi:hypothetical protein